MSTQVSSCSQTAATHQHGSAICSRKGHDCSKQWVATTAIPMGMPNAGALRTPCARQQPLSVQQPATVQALGCAMEHAQGNNGWRQCFPVLHMPSRSIHKATGHQKLDRQHIQENHLMVLHRFCLLVSGDSRSRCIRLGGSASAIGLGRDVVVAQNEHGCQIWLGDLGQGDCRQRLSWRGGGCEQDGGTK